MLEVEDIIHEAFHAVLLNPAKLKGMSLPQVDRFFRSLIRSVIRNHARNAHRRKRSSPAGVRILFLSEIGPLDMDRCRGVAMGSIPRPEDPARCEEVLSRTVQALDLLADADAVLFLEVCLHGFSIRTVAERLGIEPETASARLFAAKRKLRETLGELFYL
jgi:RNA polymerase sigma factor (sigma-70 family)